MALQRFLLELEPHWFFLLATGLLMTLLLSVSGMAWLWRRRHPFPDEGIERKRPWRWRWSVAVNLSTLLVISNLLIWRLPRLHSFGDPTVLDALVIPLALVVLSDVGNYWLHRFSHSPWMWKHSHWIHHEPRPPRTLFDAYHEHPVEFALLTTIVFLPVMLVPMHAAGAMLYLFVNALAALFSHSGAWLVFGRVFDTRLHYRHHLHARGNYAQIFPFIDDLFGTALDEARQRGARPVGEEVTR